MKRARPNGLVILLLVMALLTVATYFAEVPKNPPGFFVNESSIAYDANLISLFGADEHGQKWPPLLLSLWGVQKPNLRLSACWSTVLLDQASPSREP